MYVDKFQTESTGVCSAALWSKGKANRSLTHLIDELLHDEYPITCHKPCFSFATQFS